MDDTSQQQGYSQSDVDNAINQTAAIAGMDPAHWRAVAQIESSQQPWSNYDKGTQYKGLFQIGTRGDQSEWATHGSGNVYNPYDNALAAAKLAAANNAQFQSYYGRAPTPIETYMMHQQGFGFYRNGTMTNIAGNMYARGIDPSQQTPQSFESGWGNKLEDLAARYGGQAVPYQSVAGTRAYGGPGSAVPTRAGTRIAMPGNVMAQQQGGDGQQQPDSDQSGGTQGPDVAAQMQAVRDRIEQEDQANAPQPMQPFQFQPVMTPAMMRARQLAMIMRLRALGIDPTGGGGGGSGSGLA